MKLITKLILSCLLAFNCLYGQKANSIIKFDSSFTLTRRLHQDKQGIRQHGVFFNEKSKIVYNDFITIETLSLIDLSKYQKQIILDEEHLIKIWKAKTRYENILKIIEINSIYTIDTTDYGHKFKDTIIYNDYFIQFKDTVNNIYYQTIDRLGVSKYSVGNRQVSARRESTLVGLFYVDNTDKINKLISKYNFSQQEYLQ